MTAGERMQSRRALVSGGIAGIVALVAGAVGRPFTAQAGATDNPVVMTQTNTAGALTTLVSDTSAFKGVAKGGGGIGLNGQTSSSTGIGVQGFNNAATGNAIGVRGGAKANGIGVYGSAGRGVVGESGVAGGAGLVGKHTGTSTGGAGVRALAVNGASNALYAENLGATGGGTAIIAQSKTETTVVIQNTGIGTEDGLRVDAPGVGVLAQGRTAVRGEAFNLSGDAVGIRGVAGADGHIAGSFESTDPAGLALVATGRVRFEGACGRDAIAPGENSVTVTPGVPLGSLVQILVTLQSNPGAGVFLSHVERGASTFVVHLNQATVGGVQVGWIVIER